MNARFHFSGRNVHSEIAGHMLGHSQPCKKSPNSFQSGCSVLHSHKHDLCRCILKDCEAPCPLAQGLCPHSSKREKPKERKCYLGPCFDSGSAQGKLEGRLCLSLRKSQVRIIFTAKGSRTRGRATRTSVHTWSPGRNSWVWERTSPAKG